jgi:hypothetical protein
VDVNLKKENTMGSARKRQMALMSNAQRLDIMKKAALSMAGAIQTYQESLLHMIDDRHELYDLVDIDATIIADGLESMEWDSFLEGTDCVSKAQGHKVRMVKVGNDKVSGRIGSK